MQTVACPVCGYLARETKHPRRSHTLPAVMQLLDHIRLYHQDEIERREANEQ